MGLGLLLFQPTLAAVTAFVCSMIVQMKNVTLSADEELIEHMRELGIPEEDRSKLLRSARQPSFTNRVKWTARHVCAPPAVAQGRRRGVVDLDAR